MSATIVTHIEQLFEHLSAPSSGSARSTSAPTPVRQPSEGPVAATSSTSTTPSPVNGDQVMTPEAVLQNYRRYLTSYEADEISQYKTIYYFGASAKKITPSKDRPNFGYDDEKNRLRLVRHDHLGYRFEILKGLGKGSFGDCVSAVDHKTGKNVAVKCIRNERRFHKQAQIEIKLLNQLKDADKADSHNVIHMLDHFVFRGHICIVFELLGNGDLYSALKKTDFRGFELSTIRDITHQLLIALKFMRRLNMIHCDLKPENILLRDSALTSLLSISSFLHTTTEAGIKLIDFGSACYESERVHTYIQSRFYRAPEVILGGNGGKYGCEIDMWSLGCMLAEFYNGQPLFPGHDEKEALLLHMELVGLPSADFLAASKRGSVFFDEQRVPKFPIDHKGHTRTPGSRTLVSLLGGCPDAHLVDFISRCLVLDPAQRMTPADALKHPFIAGLAPLKHVRRSSEGALPISRTLPLPPIKRGSAAAQVPGSAPRKPTASKPAQTLSTMC